MDEPLSCSVLPFGDCGGSASQRPGQRLRLGRTVGPSGCEQGGQECIVYVPTEGEYDDKPCDAYSRRWQTFPATNAKPRSRRHVVTTLREKLIKIGAKVVHHSVNR